MFETLRPLLVFGGGFAVGVLLWQAVKWLVRRVVN